MNGKVFTRLDIKDSIIKTYKMGATDFLNTYQPDRVAINEIGHWFEHPKLGDESPLLLILPFNDEIHLTNSFEVLSAEDMGLNWDPVKRPKPARRI